MLLLVFVFPNQIVSAKSVPNNTNRVAMERKQAYLLYGSIFPEVLSFNL